MARIKRRITRKAHMPELTLTPMIDTFCVLLVIFMVAAPMTVNSIRVDLPQGKSREVGQTQDLVITLSKNKELYFNSYPIKRKELVKTVHKALGNQLDTPVFVRADEAVSYGNVIEVVDELKQAGVRYVAMATRPR
jgi:biopolymer transport protein ExbD